MQGIEGIITGYEETFDFPRFAGLPPMRYLLASVPRAGSTWLSHCLWSSGCLGAPLEYLNFEPSGHGGSAARDPAAQHATWRRSIAYRTSPNGVYGLKAFPAMLHDLELNNQALLAEVMQAMVGPNSPRKVVRLRRRDRDAHAISYARATLSGVWRQEQEQIMGENNLAFNAMVVERCRQSIDHQEGAWDQMCSELRLAPLEIWFEDALSDPSRATATVCAYLGVALDPAVAITVPPIRQQAQEGARQWAQKLVEG